MDIDSLLDLCSYEDLIDIRNFIVERIKNYEKTCSVR